jgi:hypothetical protein
MGPASPITSLGSFSALALGEKLQLQLQFLTYGDMSNLGRICKGGLMPPMKVVIQ